MNTLKASSCLLDLRLITALAIGLVSWPALADSDQTASGATKVHAFQKVDCNAQGECRADITALSRKIDAACDARRVWMSWAKAHPQASLVICDCACSSHDNIGWIVQQQGDDVPIRAVRLGKIARIAGPELASGRVRDVMASHPWCEAGASRAAPNRSVFVTLMKRPTGSEKEPYCFTPAFFIRDTAGRVVQAVDGSAKVDVSRQDQDLLGIGRDVRHIRKQLEESRGD